MGLIQFPSMVPSITIGGVVFTDIDNLIELAATNDSTAGQKYSTVRLGSAAAGYAVPASKSFYIRATATFLISAAAAAKNAYIGYADNDVGLSAAGAPTNPVYFGGSPGASYILPANVNGTFQNPRCEMAFQFTVPTGKYLFYTLSNGLEAQVRFYGYAK